MSLFRPPPPEAKRARPIAGEHKAGLYVRFYGALSRPATGPVGWGAEWGGAQKWCYAQGECTEKRDPNTILFVFSC